MLAADEPTLIDWRLLRGLDFKTGKRSPALEKVAGANVRLRGFMMPFDDEENKAVEFLVVPVMGQCVHLPPPPPNQIVLVRMAGDQLTKIWFQDLIAVEGKLEIAEQKSPYGEVSYKITATKVTKEER
jgi:uncharacterized protein